MDNLTWVGVVAFMMVAMQLLSLYNSFHTATKNAHEPLQKVENRVIEIEKTLSVMEHNMERLKEDVDHAHQKIRANEERNDKVAKAQSNALLAILLWVRDPDHEDKRKIDDAIKAITEL